jgi:hypothetical protein
LAEARPGTSKKGSDKGKDKKKGYETLALPISQGAYVDLELQSKQLQIDVPFQRFAWKGQPHRAVFVVRLATHEKEPECTLHVKINACPVGRIPFDLRVRARQAKAIFSGGVFDQQTEIYALEGRGNGVLRYQTVFLSYADDDEDDVMHLADGLNYGGVANVITHRTHFAPIGQNWFEHAKKTIETSDVVLLCWSSRAAGSTGQGTAGIQKEIDFALEQEIVRPAFRLIPMMIGDETEDEAPLPSFIEDRSALSNFHYIRTSRRKRTPSPPPQSQS